MIAAIRPWMGTVGTIAGALAAYVVSALVVAALTGSAMVGAVVSNLVALVVMVAVRWRRTGTPLAPAPRPGALRPSFWAVALMGLAACWLFGQTAAMLVLNTWGDPAFEAVSQVKVESPVWLLLLVSIVLAPLGEEALVRGTVYPELRRRWGVIASAFVTASVFALLHGNMVQLVLTLPLGMLLALVYEASQRLWPVVLLHAVFNIVSMFTPSSAVESIAQAPMVACALAAALVLLFALRPSAWGHADEGAAGETA